MRKPDATHSPALRSWVLSANLPTTDFPIQNLPFGRFVRAARGVTVLPATLDSLRVSAIGLCLRASQR